MWERACFPTTILAQPHRQCRPRHPYAVPRTSLQCVCTRRRNCIAQLSPSRRICASDCRFSSPELTRIATSRSARPSPGRVNAGAAVERAAYDEPLKDVDLLLMPTLPLKATLLPARDASREDYVARALEMISNTCPFDVTGHPAATVPAGMSAGLPCWHNADRTPLGGRHGVACSGRVPDRRIDGSRELPANGNAGVQGSETGGRALSDASLCRLGSDPSTTLPHITADEHEG